MDQLLKMIVAIDRSINDGAVDLDRARQDHYLYQGAEHYFRIIYIYVPRISHCAGE
jgi:hypothetical protein